jgi:hypothetical protein
MGAIDEDVDTVAVEYADGAYAQDADVVLVAIGKNF